MLSREQINNLNSNYKIADAQNTKTIHATLRCAEIRAMRDWLLLVIKDLGLDPLDRRNAETDLAAYDKLIEEAHEWGHVLLGQYEHTEDTFLRTHIQVDDNVVTPEQRRIMREAL